MGLVGFFAGIAKEPEEALCDYGHERRSHQERFDLHIYKSRDSACGIVRMEGGEDEVSRERCVNCDICGLSIPDLADQDHVGVLAEYGSEAVCECEVYFRIYLDLIDPLNLVFDGVFDSDNFFVRRIYPFKSCVEASSFTAARRSGDQYYAVRAQNQAFEYVELLSCEPEVLKT